ncbi:MAG: cache domain-containing protein [Methylococcaceae bacterium]|jgi:PAS domain-containing protein
MSEERVFISLRWKLGLLFGLIFIILYGLFAYLNHVNGKHNFTVERQIIQSNQVDTFKALAKDSYSSLLQFTQLLSVISTQLCQPDKASSHPVIDKNWGQWQLSWGIENAIFFDTQGEITHSFGPQWKISDDLVAKVFHDQVPELEFFCQESCFQQVIAPLPGKTGSLSVARAFGDVIARYRRLTNSDIGILVEGLVPTQNWPYKLASITQPEKYEQVFYYLVKNYLLDEFFDKSKIIEFNKGLFEVRINPYQVAATGGKAILILFINDITAEAEFLKKQQKLAWLHGAIGLFILLSLLMICAQSFLKRVNKLSDSLPLLAAHQFAQFKKRITAKDSYLLGYDELNQLNDSALALTDQLEQLDQRVRINTFKMLEKSEDLVKERDSIKHMLEFAPIIIMTQKLNGMILSLNQFAVDLFETDRTVIVGKVFDMYLPSYDQEHLAQLAQLRAGNKQLIQTNGRVLLESGKLVNVVWLHMLLSKAVLEDEAIVLSLGVLTDVQT